MIELPLSKIAEMLGFSLQDGTPVLGATTDSREIKGGELFVPIAGERFNGHRFIDAALASGAAAALSEEPYSGCGRVLRVQSTRQALGRLAREYKRMLNPLTVALTGSVGKTTTKEMTAAALGTKYKTHKTPGNFNNDIGLPLTLLGLNRGDGCLVAEMGMSHSGEIAALSAIAEPDIALITNVGTSHIEYLGSRENILKAKLEIETGMASGGAVALNADNDLLGACEIRAGLRRISWGITSPSADVRAEDIAADENGSSFTARWTAAVNGSAGEQRVNVGISGRHNIYNALAALTAALLAGADAAEAAEAIASVRPEGMRQSVVEKNGVRIIEDCYNANPDSMRAALDVLAEEKPRRRVALLGDMLELGSYSEEAHREIGRYAVGRCEELIAVGAQAQKLAEEFPGAAWFQNQAEAKAFIARTRREGDTWLVKGSRGMKMEELIKYID